MKPITYAMRWDKRRVRPKLQQSSAQRFSGCYETHYVCDAVG